MFPAVSASLLPGEEGEWLTVRQYAVVKNPRRGLESLSSFRGSAGKRYSETAGKKAIGKIEDLFYSLPKKRIKGLFLLDSSSRD